MSGLRVSQSSFVPQQRCDLPPARNLPARRPPTAVVPTEPEDPDLKTPAPRLIVAGRDVSDVARRLDADPAFRRMRDENCVEAIAWLFSDPSLPGTSARERFDFVMGYLNDPTRHGLPFRVRLPDSGFKPEFSDDALWPISHQGGHFLAAVKLGGHDNAILRFGYKAGVIGHEMVGDEKGYIWQVLRGLLALLFERHGRRFDRAVDAAIQGDDETVRRLCREIVPLPEEPGAWTEKRERVGNSQQDMRLTVYGWALGELIRTGKLARPQDVGAWIRANIGACIPARSAA